ncbi:GDYXXLXY domain-containing protein [Hymenobacter psychrotolerans]|uniref:Uncharacterized membrane-anchored protein n=1 Tax=Hymenobacter psychrotolerans DSM 18569 TaxID=1121959 RepID=A0A1M7AC57_9BACT|nr:GDYXXLXY domain-containing protein [Hymenobacter psychrotolerans]SHL40307.1 Uncharacterized membrane-anchored protein [Hymenobacter psychrotolerans DSM 18569]
MSTPLPSAPDNNVAATRHPPLPKPHRQRWLLWLVGAQLLFVLAVAAAGYATGRFGSVVVLRTRPVDPRALRFNDYLELHYTISLLPGHLWKGSTLPRRKDPVYVVLQPRPGAFEAVAVYPERPDVEPGQTVLRGWVADTWRRSMRLRYGLERYYVPEETRRKLRRQQPLQVQVSVAPWGQARISQVEVLPAERAMP